MELIGSSSPLVILSHHNCEIYCCHLDGYQKNTIALLNRLSEIEAIFLSKPVHAKFRIWYNMDENNLDSGIMELIAESISRFEAHIFKIAFIGLHGFSQRKFDRILEKALKQTPIPKAYFENAERAKGWLI